MLKTMNPVRPVRLLPQVGIISLAVLAYFLVRGATDSAFGAALRNAHRVIDFERALHLYHEPYLQETLARSAHVRGFFNGIYIYGHWPVIAVTMLWLAWRHREQFLRLRDGMLLSGLVGMVIYATYPVVPPRLLDGLGLTDTVTQRSEAYRVLQPPAFVNQYAAMPSLHAGWDLLVGIAIVAATTSTLLRVVGCLMPVLMALSTVATANHYVIDVVAGIALVLLADQVALLLARRRRAAAADPTSAPEVLEREPT